MHTCPNSRCPRRRPDPAAHVKPMGHLSCPGGDPGSSLGRGRDAEPWELCQVGWRYAIRCWRPQMYASRPTQPVARRSQAPDRPVAPASSLRSTSRGRVPSADSVHNARSLGVPLHREKRTALNGIKLVDIYAIPMTCEALDGGFASADIVSSAVCAPAVNSDRDDGGWPPA